jgi:1,2-diacylglycerol 3-alpha-glucosyltransferase
LPTTPSPLLFDARGLVRALKWDSCHALATARRHAPATPMWREIVFIVGCGRSGATLVAELLAQHDDVHSLESPRARWTAVDVQTDDIDLFGSGRGRLRFPEAGATPEQSRYFRRLFGARDPGARRVLVETLAQNCFRIPWLRSLAPAGRILHIVRNWPAVVASITRLGPDASCTISGRPLWNRWWGRRYAKLDRFLDELAGSPLLPVDVTELSTTPSTAVDFAKLAACEWYASIQAVHAARASLGDDFLEVRYEDLVRDPRGMLARIFDFAGLQRDARALERAARMVGAPAGAVEPPPPVSGPLREACDALARELGYETPAPPSESRKVESHRPRGGLRVAILFERFGPYHDARVRAAAAMMPVHAIEIFRRDETYAWDPLPEPASYPKATLFPHPAGSKAQKRDALWKALERAAPAVVAVPGWASWYSHAALAWAKRHGARIVVMSETTRSDRERVASLELAKKALLAGFDAALVGGTPQWRYLVELGFPPGNIQLGYDAVDNDHFVRGSNAARARAREVRERHGLPDRYFLASCRLIRRKNVDGLLRAFALYRGRAGAQGCDLVVVGDGPERQRLTRSAIDLGVAASVRFAGFRQYPELPELYALATAFILPSLTEPWGLVANEAMASGIPVLVSETAGCARDLVVAGRTGWRFPPRDATRLAELLTMLARDPDAAAKMGEAARRHIAGWGPSRFASGLAGACDTALKEPSTQLSFGVRLMLRAAALG